MLRTITYPQLIEWYEYAQLEPFGEIREDYRTAHVVSTLINIHRDHKRTKAVSIEDCLLEFGDSKRPEKKQSWKEQKMIAMMLAASWAEN